MVVGMVDKRVAEPTNEPVKYTVNLSPPAMAALALAAERTHTSRTTVINRALQVYAMLAEEQWPTSKQMMLVGDDGSAETFRIIF